MRNILPALLLLISLVMGHAARAQGCSDAGACSVGSLAGDVSPVNGADTTLHGYVEMSFTHGSGEQDVNVDQAKLEAGFHITRRLSAQLIVPFTSTNGELGNTSGLGDITASLSYRFLHNEDRDLAISLGAKLPTGDASLAANGRALPMPYQLSLGTTDLVIGSAYRFRKWTAGVGFQHILADMNRNGYLRVLNLDDAEAQQYFDSRELHRGDDALARVQYTFGRAKVKITPGLLGIYHLTNSTIEDVLGNRVEQVGSDGLTLNLTANVRYALGDHFEVGAGYAMPVITRKVRPDGLTRHWVALLSLRYKF